LAQLLTRFAGTPNIAMSLSRSPSPHEGGGWSSPGLTSQYGGASGRESPALSVRSSHTNGNNVSWESAQKKTASVKGGPSLSMQNGGFFNRHMRSISSSLPTFNLSAEDDYDARAKGGRGKWTTNSSSLLGRLRVASSRVSRKMKLRLLVLLAFVFSFILFYTTRKSVISLSLLLPANIRSTALLLAQDYFLRRRQEICDHTCRKSRRRCNGVEGTKRVGH